MPSVIIKEYALIDMRRRCRYGRTLGAHGLPGSAPAASVDMKSHLEERDLALNFFDLPALRDSRHRIAVALEFSSRRLKDFSITGRLLMAPRRRMLCLTNLLAVFRLQVYTRNVFTLSQASFKPEASHEGTIV